MNILKYNNYNIKKYLITNININYSFNNNEFYISEYLIEENDIQLNINNLIYLMSIKELDLINELYDDPDILSIFNDNLYNLLLISSLIGYLDGILWLNEKFKLNNDDVYLISYNILNNKKIKKYEIIRELLEKKLNFDDRLSYLAIIYDDIKILELCKNNNLIKDNINKYIIEKPDINIIKWLINNNFLDIRDLCVDMIKKKNYKIVEWLYLNKHINEQYIITKAILFNDIYMLNFIFIQSGYEFFHNEFIIYRMMNKMKLPVIKWFLQKNIVFNTDNLFKLAFTDNNIDDSMRILKICYQYKLDIYDKNLNLKYLNNNKILLNEINLDDKIIRKYLFNLNNNDLNNCYLLNEKITNKKNEIDNYIKLSKKLKLPDDIINNIIIKYF